MVGITASSLMGKNPFHKILLVAPLLALAALDAGATLGGAPMTSQTLSTAAIKKQATTPGSAAALYSVHETTLDNGTVLREFADSRSGQVFALTWRGPVLPDMQDLLGSYLPVYQQQLAQRRAQGLRRGPVAIQHATLVLRSSGRMRNFSGQAYAPALLPSGVAIADLQP
jgi:hypothetical protein